MALSALPFLIGVLIPEHAGGVEWVVRENAQAIGVRGRLHRLSTVTLNARVYVPRFVADVTFAALLRDVGHSVVHADPFARDAI